MNTNKRNVLICGGSGHLGQLICQELQNCGKDNFDVCLLLPEESVQQHKQEISNINYKVCDLLTCDVNQLKEIIKDFDIVINCCRFDKAQDELNSELKLIDVCKQNNIKRYIPSDFSIDFRNCKDINLERIQNRIKIHDTLEKQNTLQWTSILCGTIMEKFFSTDLGIVNFDLRTISYFGDGYTESFQLTSYNDIAKFCCHLLLQEFDKCANQTLQIWNEELTVNDLLNRIGKVQKKEWRFNCLGDWKGNFNERLEKVKDNDKEYSRLQYWRCMSLPEGKLKNKEERIWNHLKNERTSLEDCFLNCVPNIAQ
ncbi:hypothetical protein ABK040_002829 [Willaertia magna]